MSAKVYLLNVRLMKCNYIGIQTTEVVDGYLQRYKDILAALSAELVAAGLSDGVYTEPYYSSFMFNHEFVVTDPLSAALIAEKYSSEVHIARSGGTKHFLFESYRAVPTWLFREVTAAQREFMKLMHDVTGRLEYLRSVADNAEQLKLLRDLESNAQKATTIDRLAAVQGRIEFHRKNNPSW